MAPTVITRTEVKQMSKAELSKDEALARMIAAFDPFQ